MENAKVFIVPDYYPDFLCKMGACRTACCEGWPITFSISDYFKLLGEECSSELRKKIDCALHLTDFPTSDSYAMISPRYDGHCPMRLDDGRCALHAEMGENALAAVCRLYPRGIRSGSHYECSCANSCEAVIELLLKHDRRLEFVEMSLKMDIPINPQRLHCFETAGREWNIRMWLISFLQRREFQLPQRMLMLGEAMNAIDLALSEKNFDQVDRLLSNEESIAAPDGLHVEYDQLMLGLDAAGRMLEIIDARSESIRSYGESVLAYFGHGEIELNRYEYANSHFAEVVPQWEHWFENMLVNHMFFEQFPFQDRPVPLKDEYIALCAVYALLRFLCVGWMAEHENIDEAVDVAAAAFRLIDHTEFDRYAASILKSLGCDNWTHLRQILCL